MLRALSDAGRRVDRLIVAGLRVVIAFILAGMVLAVTYQVLSRTAGILPPLLGTEEVARGLFIWLVLLGASLGVREVSHFSVDILPVTSPGGRRALAVFAAVVVLVGAAVLFVQGWSFAQSGLRRHSLATGLPAAWSYSSIFVGGALMTLFAAKALLAAAFGGKDAPEHADG